MAKGKWEIEKTVSYWYWDSRNGKSYIELTFWYNTNTLERKETKREVRNVYDHYSLPDWAKTITTHNKGLDSNW